MYCTCLIPCPQNRWITSPTPAFEASTDLQLLTFQISTHGRADLASVFLVGENKGKSCTSYYLVTSPECETQVCHQCLPLITQPSLGWGLKDSMNTRYIREFICHPCIKMAGFIWFHVPSNAALCVMVCDVVHKISKSFSTSCSVLYCNTNIGHTNILHNHT